MKKLPFIAIAALSLTVLLFLIFRPVSAQGRLESVLNHAGFKHVSITGSSRQKDGHVYDSIHLDRAEFSTIGGATLMPRKDDRLSTLTLDKLILTGDWRNGTLPEISGWQAPSSLRRLADSLRKNKIDMLILNGGQFDVIVPFAGLIRLEAKGHLHLMPDGAIRMQGVLWSVQKQLKAEIHVNGEFAKNGIASIDFEVADGRISLSALEANRLGGWLILNKNAGSAPWAISAQLVAGMAKLYNLALSGLTLSANGDLHDMALTLQAGGNSGTALAVDAQLKTKGKDKVTATLRSDDSAFLLHALSGSESAFVPVTGGTRGVSVFYEAEAEKAKNLQDNAVISIGDLAGQLWMNATLRKTPNGAELDIQQTRLQELGRALGLKDFTSDGALTGLVPLLWGEEGKIHMDQGLLRATSPATLSYNAPSFPPFLQTGREDALSLLRSFSYDSLEILLEGPLSEDVGGDISLTGISLAGKSLEGGEQKPTRLTFSLKATPEKEALQKETIQKETGND